MNEILKNLRKSQLLIADTIDKMSWIVTRLRTGKRGAWAVHIPGALRAANTIAKLGQELVAQSEHCTITECGIADLLVARIVEVKIRQEKVMIERCYDAVLAELES